MKKMLTLITLLLAAALLLGTSWEVVQQSSPGFSPYDGHFFDADSGILVGADAAVYMTADGGLTMTAVLAEDAAKPNLRKVDFYGKTGMAVGDDGIALKTADGGRTWTDISPDSALAYEGDLAAVSVVSDLVAYVCGDDSTLLKTVDGGSTWTRSSFGFDGEDLDGGVAFYDEDHGVVIADAISGLSWYTADGGDSWTFTSIAQYFPVTAITSKLYGVDAADGVIAIIGYHQTLFLSTDGGQTYSLAGPYAFTNVYNSDLQVLDANTIYAAGQNGWLVRTVDGGANWEELHFGSGHKANLISFPNSNDGFVFADDMQYFATHDGGTSWTPLTAWPSIRFQNIEARNDQHLLTACWGAGDMTESFDAGATWSHPTNTKLLSHVDIWEIEFYDEQKGLIGGDSNSSIMISVSLLK